VGFIQKLPTTLVAAFRATLEEIAEADLLLHVVDITHQNAQAQATAVHQTLQEIEAGHVPIVVALNKIDKLNDPERARQVLTNFPNAVAISALTGTGIPDLLQLVSEQLYENYVSITVRIPYDEGGLIALFHEQGEVERIEHRNGGVEIQGRLPVRVLAQFKDYQVPETGSVVAP
jgi:GTP-binding protein HflX